MGNKDKTKCKECAKSRYAVIGSIKKKKSYWLHCISWLIGGCRIDGWQKTSPNIGRYRYVNTLGINDLLDIPIYRGGYT